MVEPGYLLATPDQRQVVLDAIQALAVRLDWSLYAAHVRTNHVHVVVGAPVVPEQVMTRIKAAASRALGKLDAQVRRWAEHGSGRYLWKPESVERAVQYVVAEQGEPMAVYDSQME